MRVTSQRRTATRTACGRKPTTPRPCTRAGTCSRACATSRRTRCARDSRRIRAPIPGRATARTRSARTTLSSRRTRITVRSGVRPTSVARRTRRCSWGAVNGSLQFHAGGPDYFHPELVVAPDPRGKFPGPAAPRDAALGEQALLHFRRREDGRSIALDARDQRRRHSCRPEQRVPEIDFWYALLGPAGMPAPLVARIQRDAAAILTTPEMKESLLAQGCVAGGSGPGELSARIRSDYELWVKVIRTAGVKLE